jgi:mRNA interferase RelE/StbE|tara:strand:- start:33 stop:305 length:273 start_codon:yes stop_codon:yes gene_type:complete
MIYKIVYAKNAINQLNKLPKPLRKRITDKLYFYSKQDNPLSFARKLTTPVSGEYRFRIGEYRAIFDIDKQGNINVLLILAIRHRKDIYRK